MKWNTTDIYIIKIVQKTQPNSEWVIGHGTLTHDL